MLKKAKKATIVMNITVCEGVAYQEPSSLVAIGVCEEEPLEEKIASLLEADDFCGKPQQATLIYPRGELPPKRVLLLGLGKREKLTTDTVRQAAARAARRAHELKVADVAIQMPFPEGVSPDTAAQIIVEGANLGLYRYLKYKSEPKPEETHQVDHLNVFVEGDQEAARDGAHIGHIVSDGVMFARNLANTPPNDLYPERLAALAKEMGERSGLRVTVLEQHELEEQGFGGLLAVGQGSRRPPRFIILEHNEASPERPTICLVGKGITFDTGGISIKPSSKMDEMKFDMCGAAAVLGTMQVVGELNLPLHVVGLVSAAENMPDGNAYRPGDIIKTLSGKTVEVLNTDAEGRIVLSDALFYAQRYTPKAIVDLATLTGAIVVALGSHAVGLMSNNPSLAEQIIQAGEATFERVWQLPLWEEHHEVMKSKVADLKNIGDREASSITAAAFLAAFVGDYPWVHLDIAGTAWIEKPKQAYNPGGATGIGVRLLTHVLRNWKDD